MGEIIKIPAVGSSTPCPPCGGTYGYGEPAGTSGTDGGGTVVAQWTFEEASGDVVDGVNSIAVPVVGIVPRLMQANAFFNGAVGASTGWSGYFSTTTDPTAINPGTASFVLECTAIFNTWATSSEQYLIDTKQTISTSGFHLSYYTGVAQTDVIFYVVASDGSASQAYWPTIAASRVLPVDGVVKFRVAVNRSVSPATATLWYNGTSFGAKTLTNITSLKSIEPTAVTFGRRTDFDRIAFCIMKEIRITTGTTTANSGGPGGG
jgi:hypothetical protein